MKKLTEKEKDRMNQWRFYLMQFGFWKNDDENLFKRLVYEEDK